MKISEKYRHFRCRIQWRGTKSFLPRIRKNAFVVVRNLFQREFARVDGPGQPDDIKPHTYKQLQHDDVSH